MHAVAQSWVGGTGVRDMLHGALDKAPSQDTLQGVHNQLGRRVPRGHEVHQVVGQGGRPGDHRAAALYGSGSHRSLRHRRTGLARRAMRAIHPLLPFPFVRSPASGEDSGAMATPAW
jgi:hypothetical protein